MGLHLKRRLALACLAAVSLIPAQARAAADDHVVKFPVAGTIPCGAPEPDLGLCARDPAGKAFGLEPCGNPSPPVGFVDLPTEPAPQPPEGKQIILELKTYPQIDWDAFICDGPAELARDSYRKSIDDIEKCDNGIGADQPIPIGCWERARTPVMPGHTYTLRAFNRLDVADLVGVYRWVFL